MNKSTELVLQLLVGLFILTGPANSRGLGSPWTAAGLLRKTLGAVENRPPVDFDSETIVTYPGNTPEPGEIESLRYTHTFRQDKDKIDLISRVAATIDGKEMFRKEGRRIWDGNQYVIRYRSAGTEHKAYVSTDTKLRGIALNIEFKDGFLDGYIGRGQGRLCFADMLHMPCLRLEEKLERVKGHSCYVVDAKDDINSYQVWVDPNVGYYFRKLLFAGKGYEVQIYDVEVERIGEVYFPIKGKIDVHMIGAGKNGSNLHLHRSSIRRRISLNPDFSKIGAFQMDLPEGTRIANKNDKVNQYVWRNGRAQNVDSIHCVMVGSQSPVLKVKKWYNSKTEGFELKGKVILLDFFGVWCRPCMAKIPFFKALHTQYSDRGLIIIGIHTAQSCEKIPEFISRDKIEYPITVDEHGQNAKSFNVFFYPTTVLIDKGGIIRAVNPSEKELESLLENLLEQKA